MPQGVYDRGKSAWKPNNKGSGFSYRWLMSNRNFESDVCLPWPFNRSRGYGTLGYMGKVLKAHRLMCETAHGPAPSPDHEAAHSCGNHGCVNPRHLSWKARAENQADSVAMGRFYNGGRRGKLSRDQVAQIRALRGKVSQDDLAAQFGVTHSTVAKIHRGETWRDAG